MAFLEAEGLSKTYVRRLKPTSGGLSRLWLRETERICALQDVSFSAERGELVGILGPNGAGKSTVVKLLTGILTPTEGTCRVDGRVPWRERREHVRHLGAVFGQRTQLWWDVPVSDSYALLRDIYRLEPAAWKRRLDELTDALDLGDFLRTPLRQLSLGQRMRAELCGSLLHGPALLFLDEPTIGLDAVSKLAVRSFIRERNAAHGTTVLLTTHDMQDIEALTSRILLIGKGRILLDGRLDVLKERYLPAKALTVSFSGTLGELPEGARVLEAREGHAVLETDPARLPVGALIAALSGQVELTDLTVSGASTEELVLRLYRDYSI